MIELPTSQRSSSPLEHPLENFKDLRDLFVLAPDKFESHRIPRTKRARVEAPTEPRPLDAKKQKEATKLTITGEEEETNLPHFLSRDSTIEKMLAEGIRLGVISSNEIAEKGIRIAKTVQGETVPQTLKLAEKLTPMQKAEALGLILAGCGGNNSFLEELMKFNVQIKPLNVDVGAFDQLIYINSLSVAGYEALVRAEEEFSYHKYGSEVKIPARRKIAGENRDEYGKKILEDYYRIYKSHEMDKDVAIDLRAAQLMFNFLLPPEEVFRLAELPAKSKQELDVLAVEAENCQNHDERKKLERQLLEKREDDNHQVSLERQKAYIALLQHLGVKSYQFDMSLFDESPEGQKWKALRRKPKSEQSVIEQLVLSRRLTREDMQEIVKLRTSITNRAKEKNLLSLNLVDANREGLISVICSKVPGGQEENIRKIMKEAFSKFDRPGFNEVVNRLRNEGFKENQLNAMAQAEITGNLVNQLTNTFADNTQLDILTKKILEGIIRDRMKTEYSLRERKGKNDQIEDPSSIALQNYLLLAMKGLDLLQRKQMPGERAYESFMNFEEERSRKLLERIGEAAEGRGARLIQGEQVKKKDKPIGKTPPAAEVVTHADEVKTGVQPPAAEVVTHADEDEIPDWLKAQPLEKHPSIPVLTESQIGFANTAARLIEADDLRIEQNLGTNYAKAMVPDVVNALRLQVEAGRVPSEKVVAVVDKLLANPAAQAQTEAALTEAGLDLTAIKAQIEASRKEAPTPPVEIPIEAKPPVPTETPITVTTTGGYKAELTASTGRVVITDTGNINPHYTPTSFDSVGMALSQFRAASPVDIDPFQVEALLQLKGEQLLSNLEPQLKALGIKKTEIVIQPSLNPPYTERLALRQADLKIGQDNKAALASLHQTLQRSDVVFEIDTVTLGIVEPDNIKMSELDVDLGQYDIKKLSVKQAPSARQTVITVGPRVDSFQLESGAHVKIADSAETPSISELVLLPNSILKIDTGVAGKLINKPIHLKPSVGAVMFIGDYAVSSQFAGEGDYQIKQDGAGWKLEKIVEPAAAPLPIPLGEETPPAAETPAEPPAAAEAEVVVGKRKFETPAWLKTAAERTGAAKVAAAAVNKWRKRMGGKSKPPLAPPPPEEGASEFDNLEEDKTGYAVFNPDDV